MPLRKPSSATTWRSSSSASIASRAASSMTGKKSGSPVLMTLGIPLGASGSHGFSSRRARA